MAKYPHNVRVLPWGLLVEWLPIPWYRRDSVRLTFYVSIQICLLALLLISPASTLVNEENYLKSCNTSSTTENWLTIKLEDRNGTGHMCFENILEPNGNGAKTGKRFVLSDEESDFYCPSSNSYKKAYLKFEPSENENGFKTLELFGKKKCKFKLPKDNIVKMNMNGEMHNSYGEVIECQELEFDTSQYVQEFENAQEFGAHWADYDFFFLIGKLLLSSNASEIEAHGGIQIEDQCTVVEQDVKVAIIDNNLKEFMVRNGYVYSETGNANKAKMEETIQKIFSALMVSDDYYIQKSFNESKDWFYSFTAGEFRYVPVEAALVNKYGVVRMIFHKCNNASFAIVVKNASSATVKDVKPENDWSLDFVNLSITNDVGRCNEYSLALFDIDKGENNYNAIDYSRNSNQKGSKIFEISQLKKNTVQVGIFKRTGRQVSPIEIESHRYFYGHTDKPFPIRPVMAEKLDNFNRVREWGRYLTSHDKIYKNAQEHTLAVKFERVSIRDISKYLDLGVRRQFPIEVIPVLYQQMYECYEEGLDGYAYKIYTSRFMAGQKIKIDGEMKEQMFTKNTRAFIWDGNRYDIPSDLSIVDLLPSNASEILTIEDQCTVVEQDVKVAIIENNPKEFMVRNGYVYSETGNANEAKMKETIGKIYNTLMDSDDYYIQKSLDESKDWFFSFTAGEFRYVPEEAAFVNKYGVVRMIFHKCNNASFGIVVKNASSATVKDVKPENDWSLDFANLTIKNNVGRCNEYSLEMFDIDKGENNYNAIDNSIIFISQIPNEKERIFEISKLSKNTVRVGIFKRTGRKVSPIEIESHRYFYGHTDKPFPIRPVMAEELNNFYRVREWGRYITSHGKIYKNTQEHTLAVRFERVSIQEINEHFVLGVRQELPVEVIPVLYQQMYECYEEGLDGYAYKIYTSRFLASQKIKILIDGEMKEPMFTKYTKTLIWDGIHFDVPPDISIFDLWKEG